MDDNLRGKRVRITQLIDARDGKSWKAGDSYEGIVSDLDGMGFFDLNMDNGEAICFNAGDQTIKIEVL